MRVCESQHGVASVQRWVRLVDHDIRFTVSVLSTVYIVIVSFRDRGSVPETISPLTSMFSLTPLPLRGRPSGGVPD